MNRFISALILFVLFSSNSISLSASELLSEDANNLYDMGKQSFYTGDLELSRMYFEQAAEQNHAEAQYCLGRIYLNGVGVDHDYDMARKWFLLAAEQNHAAAQRELGEMYFSATGVERNYEKAKEWLLLAAEQSEGLT